MLPERLGLHWERRVHLEIPTSFWTQRRSALYHKKNETGGILNDLVSKSSKQLTTVCTYLAVRDLKVQ